MESTKFRGFFAEFRGFLAKFRAGRPNSKWFGQFRVFFSQIPNDSGFSGNFSAKFRFLRFRGSQALEPESEPRFQEPEPRFQGTGRNRCTSGPDQKTSSQIPSSFRLSISCVESCTYSVSECVKSI